MTDRVQPSGEIPARIEFQRRGARKRPAVSYLGGPIRVSVGEPKLETFVHRDIKPDNILIGAGLGVPPEASANDVVEAGIPVAVLIDFGALSGMSARDLGQIIGTSERTISRRLAHDERLAPSESDRAYRLFEIVASAVRAFGDVDKALRWMKRNVPSLGGRRPIDLLRTEIGSREILSALDRIQYGGVA
jgi:putative toxin-antitoxin system antitoxin component (TIGR02293 family)